MNAGRTGPGGNLYYLWWFNWIEIGWKFLESRQLKTRENGCFSSFFVILIVEAEATNAKRNIQIPIRQKLNFTIMLTLFLLWWKSRNFISSEMSLALAISHKMSGSFDSLSFHSIQLIKWSNGFHLFIDFIRTTQLYAPSTFWYYHQLPKQCNTQTCVPYGIHIWFFFCVKRMKWNTTWALSHMQMVHDLWPIEREMAVLLSAVYN